jgi:hypothetical protein
MPTSDAIFATLPYGASVEYRLIHTVCKSKGLPAPASDRRDAQPYLERNRPDVLTIDIGPMSPLTLIRQFHRASDTSRTNFAAVVDTQPKATTSAKALYAIQKGLLAGRVAGQYLHESTNVQADRPCIFYLRTRKSQIRLSNVMALTASTCSRVAPDLMRMRIPCRALNR